MQLTFDPVKQGIIEELIFDGHLLTVVEHLQEKVGACSREELFYVLCLVLADTLEAAEGLLVLDTTT